MALPLRILAYGSQVKKNVLLGMHVNLVYNIFDAFGPPGSFSDSRRPGPIVLKTGPRDLVVPDPFGPVFG